MGAVIRAVYDFTGLGQATAAAPITVEQITPFAAFFQGGGASGVIDGNYGHVTVAGSSWTINAGVVSPGMLTPAAVAQFAPAAHGHPIAEVTGLQAALDGKAATAHGHAVADVAGLQAALDGKSPTGHGHALSDISGLAAALETKSDTGHVHVIANVTGLQSALDGKAAVSHGHAIADVSGLQTVLDGKAAASHGHAIADVSGLQTALDGKAASSHGHAISDVTGLQGALDAKLEEVAVADIAATGTPSSATYLRGDGTWAVPAGGGGGGGANWGEIGGTLGDQTDLQTALNGKAATGHSHDAATTSAAGFMSAADKTKLDGIEAGATANASDAALRDRSTHTGTQAAATITGLAAVATTGSASDLGSGTLPIARIADGAVTNAKLANMGANTVKGRANAATGAPGDIAIAASQVLGRGETGNLTALAFGNGVAVSGTTIGLAAAAEATIKGRASGAGTGAPVDLSPAQVRAVINVADGATANASDAALRDRATHTGTQAISTVSGLQDALDGKAAASHTHTASAISDSTAAGRSMLTAADAAAQTALLDTFTSGAKGLAPASGGGTTNFLRADGTWTAPPGGSGDGIAWSDPVDAHIIPDADGTRDLGSASTRWRTIYAGEIDIEDAPDLSAFTGLLGLDEGTAVDVNTKALLEARIGGADLALASGDTYAGTHDFEDATLVLPGGASVSDSDGLADPNADRLLFWDDSDGGLRWLTVGSGLSISGTTITATGGGGGIDWSTPVNANIVPAADGEHHLGSTTYRFASVHTDAIDLNGTTIDGGTSLADPGVNRLVGWDDTANEMAWITVGGGLTLSGNVLDGGDVIGPEEAADNAIARFDNTTGKLIKGSSVLVTNAGALRLPATAPSVPPADVLAFFAQKVGGRMFPSALGPSGLEMQTQPLLARNNASLWQANGNATTATVFGQAVTGTGTATARNVATTNLFTRMRRIGYPTAATAASVAGIRTNNAQYTLGAGGTPALGGFFLVVRFGIQAISATSRIFVGMRNSATAPTNVNPSTITQCVGLARIDGSTRLHIVYGGTAAQTPIDLGANFPADTANADFYELALFAPPGITETVHWQVTRLNTGDTDAGTITGDATVLPSATTLLAFNSFISNNTDAVAVGIDWASLYIEKDY